MRATNLGDLIDPDADMHKAAIVDLGDEPTGRVVTFGALREQSAAVARGLVRRGLVRGDRVAVLSGNRSEYLAACLGSMQAGLVAVPINHRAPNELTEFALRDCGAKLAFCDAPRLAACPADIPAVRFGPPDVRAPDATAASVTGFEDFLDPGLWTSVEPAADETALFLYTSGSTGRPKGVVLSHRGHLWVVRTRMAGQDLSRHRFLIAAPLYHMNALALSFLTIAAGATAVLMPQFTALGYLDAIERHRCTWLTAVPPMIAMLLREAEAVSSTDLSSVELLRMGSAPVGPKLLDAIHESMPGVTVMNAFGTTEGGPVVFGPHPAGLPTPPLSVGHRHPEVQLRLVDDAGGISDRGVLQMKCPGLMTGYHNRPDLQPSFTADGYYVTGDVFRRDAEGFFYFVGRSDDMFVCGGENVYPGEVEKLLEGHPEIAQACVVPVDDEIKGQKPVAFVVRRDGSSLTEAEVKEFALKRAPAYRHPRSIWFVDRMPMTATSKVDRAELLRLAHARRAGSA
jgi:acyl-CoA synthetase (AMP-forming)/AMP-acid ligase II